MGKTKDIERNTFIFIIIYSSRYRDSSIEMLNEFISQILLIQREEDIYDILNTTQLA